ncbi:hypothetical protein NYO67_7271 [Aspergillus flavus]|nr:hypothetical protein NYO67_7271 [Aspergillus flavus]
MCTGDVVDGGGGGGGVVVLRSKGFPSCGTTSHCTCSTNGFAESSRGWIFGATDDGNEEWGCETGQLHENRPFSAFWPQSTRLGGSLSGKDVLATSRKLSMPWGCILQTLRPFPAFPDQPEPLKRYAGGLGGTKAASLQRFLFIR